MKIFIFPFLLFKKCQLSNSEEDMDNLVEDNLVVDMLVEDMLVVDKLVVDKLVVDMLVVDKVGDKLVVVVASLVLGGPSLELVLELHPSLVVLCPSLLFACPSCCWQTLSFASLEQQRMVEHRLEQHVQLNGFYHPSYIFLKLGSCHTIGQ